MTKREAAVRPSHGPHIVCARDTLKFLARGFASFAANRPTYTACELINNTAFHPRFILMRVILACQVYRDIYVSSADLYMSIVMLYLLTETLAIETCRLFPRTFQLSISTSVTRW